MKGRTAVIFVIVLLSIAVGNYIRINQDETLRSVEFLSILAIGMLLGVLLMLIFRMMKTPDNKE